MRHLFQRLLSRSRSPRTEAFVTPRSPTLRLEDLEERCLLNASTASAAVAPLAAASNQNHITVVQNLLNQAQTDMAADIQTRTQNLATQLTQAQNRVQNLQNLVNWVQTDLTADQQAQTNSLANVVARDQGRVNKLTTEL
ncbi:MAG TPA: hypothetical protein VFA18_21575, partial [Gemmataceae bacterium]|nr:hypothetical protein [Gemmataceae bacterium]